MSQRHSGRLSTPGTGPEPAAELHADPLPLDQPGRTQHPPPRRLRGPVPRKGQAGGARGHLPPRPHPFPAAAAALSDDARRPASRSRRLVPLAPSSPPPPGGRAKGSREGSLPASPRPGAVAEAAAVAATGPGVARGNRVATVPGHNPGASAEPALARPRIPRRAGRAPRRPLTRGGSRRDLCRPRSPPPQPSAAAAPSGGEWEG